MAGLEEVVEGQFGRRLLLDRLDGKFGCLGVVGQLGIDDLLYALQLRSHRQDRVAKGGIDRLDHREDLQADLVALDVGHEVGAVRDVGPSETVEVADEVGAADAQQRAHHVALARFHARQPMDARPPDEVEEDGLHGVVAMMGHTDGLGPDSLPELAKVGVAQLACRHFDTDAMQLGVGARVEVGTVERDGQLVAQRLAEVLVAVGLVATQLEVAVDGLQAVAQVAQQQQQGHAVSATRQGDELQARLVQQSAVFDIMGDKRLQTSGFHCFNQRFFLLQPTSFIASTSVFLLQKTSVFASNKCLGFKGTIPYST